MKKHIIALVFSTVLFAVASFAQGTAFTYQGQLQNSGGPADGIYDLRFTIYDAGTNGDVIGAPLTNTATAVSNGVFTVQLDFGVGVFDGGARWLDLGVRTNGPGAFTTLAPRQPVTSSPYAIQAANAALAASAGSVLAANISGPITVGQLPSSLLTNGEGSVNLSGTFLGNGAGVTNLLAASLGLTIQPVVAWGYNYSGQTNVPPGLNNVVAVAAGRAHSLALKADGTVVAWGDNSVGQTSIPSGLSNVIAVAAGYIHSLALKNDGTVVAWGDNTFGETTIPTGLTNVLAIAAGAFHSLALKKDGTVVAWGNNSHGQTTIPSGLSNVIAVVAGDLHSLALKNDGTVVAWGDNTYGQTTIPSGLSNVVAIAAGSAHSLALKNDGTVVAWGDNTYGQATIPPGLNHVIAIAPGGTALHALALQKQLVPLMSTTAGNVQFDNHLDVSIGGSLTVGDTVTAANFSGNGGNLTNLDATTLTGTIADALLSSNVALLNGIQTFSGSNTFSSPGNAFSGNGAGLASLNAGNISSGTIADARLSPNVALLNASQNFAGQNTFAGNVGIGTNNPILPLHVYAGGNNLVSLLDSSSTVGTWLDVRNQGGGICWQIISTGSGNGEGAGKLLFSAGSALGTSGPEPLQLSASGATVNGTFNNNSDRNAKQNITGVSPAGILDEVLQLPVSQWSYKADPATRHIGPMAQDFHAAFNVGTDDKHIAPIDEGGVALAAIQGLAKQMQAENAALRTESATLRAENEDLKARLERLEHRLGATATNQ